MKEQEMSFCVLRGTFDDNLMLFWKKYYYAKCSLLFGIYLFRGFYVLLLLWTMVRGSCNKIVAHELNGLFNELNFIV